MLHCILQGSALVLKSVQAATAIMVSVECDDLDYGLGMTMGETCTKVLVLWEKSVWGTITFQTYMGNNTHTFDNHVYRAEVPGLERRQPI